MPREGEATCLARQPSSPGAGAGPSSPGTTAQGHYLIEPASLQKYPSQMEN